MQSIAGKMLTRTPIPNNSPEVGFVNQTTEPVYRLLSVGTSIPASEITGDLITRFRDLIAADYAYVFLERNLRLGLQALDKDYTLDVKQAERAKELRKRAQELLAQLSREKGILYQKVGSITALASSIEQLERQLRASMPQQIQDLLGRRAAYLR